jgi:MFS family permease
MSQEQAGQKTLRAFLIIWMGQLISILGSGLTSFALGVFIFEKTGQATPFALTVLFGNLPRILLAPLAGSLADRWNRRALMILADSGDALVTLAAVLLVSLGNLQIWHVYLISLVSAVFASFQEPAYTASVTMLVPKKDLARASGLMQMGQSVEMLISPVLAGILFLLVGLRGIFLIDFATFLFAVGALIVVRIPQPARPEEEQSGRGNLVADLIYGWQYLRARSGLFGLLVFFALVNFLLNFAAVLTGPLVLSYSDASGLGLVQMASGGGMLAGSLALSAWGGPKRRILGVIGFIALAALGLVLAGLRPGLIFTGAGMFWMLCCIPLASGPSQAIFQVKVAPGVQGRVFAMRSMISRSMMPLAFLLAGPLADFVFEPLLREEGAWAGTILTSLLEVGPGRGIGLMFVLSGLVLVLASGMAYANPRIRRVEEELPDAVEDRTDLDTPAMKPVISPAD